MRYFVRFSYLGTDFHGSQTQPNARTVQEEMEKSFSTILRAPIALTFAGRTDAGVHAEEMWAHFDDDGERNMANEELSSLTGRLNNLLPASIAIQTIIPVADDAHARFSATSRTYEYRISTRKNPFLFGQVARVAPGLNFAAMNEGAQLLIGRHDFASFCKVHTDVKTTICTITEAQWFQTSEQEAFFRITADRFLRNMVRAVVGTLMDVGRGKLTTNDLQRIISSHDRCQAGQSAPAEGLYLTHVEYPFL